MEKLKYIFLLFIGLINAQETITLEQCYQWSRENYPLIKKQELVLQEGLKARKRALEKANWKVYNEKLFKIITN